MRPYGPPSTRMRATPKPLLPVSCNAAYTQDARAHPSRCCVQSSTGRWLSSFDLKCKLLVWQHVRRNTVQIRRGGLAVRDSGDEAFRQPLCGLNRRGAAVLPMRMAKHRRSANSDVGFPQLSSAHVSTRGDGSGPRCRLRRCCAGPGLYL